MARDFNKQGNNARLPTSDVSGLRCTEPDACLGKKSARFHGFVFFLLTNVRGVCNTERPCSATVVVLQPRSGSGEQQQEKATT